MIGHTDKDFWRWLSEELADEAHQARHSGGRLPPRPVCLTEVEAVGLLVLVYDAEQDELPSGIAAGAARRLADTLQGHLGHLGGDHGRGTR